MTQNAVIGAFGVPASVSSPALLSTDQAAWMSRIETLSTDRLVYPTLSISSSVLPAAGVPGTGPADLPDSSDARGTAGLSRLAALSGPQLRDYVASNPEAVAALLAAPPAAIEVADWWASTDVAARASLAAEVPQLVGNLEGLPYPVRAAANESYLANTVESVSSKLDSAGRAAADDLRAELHMLEQVRAALATPPGSDAPARHLIGLDVADGGRAIIAVGDLATADYVSVLVPGMFYSVDSELVSWTGAASDMALEQQAWLDRLAPNQHQSVATVAWIGYRTPSMIDVASMDLAREGRTALTDSLEGLAAVRDGVGTQPYLSILTHSYGSTVALLSLQQDSVAIDALAMVGSPGSPAKTVADLNVRGGNVWVAEASLDPVADAGVFGSQPLSASYGAHRFGVTGAVDPVTGSHLPGSVGHVDYFTTGSESFRNMALIGIGRGGLVLDDDGQAAAAPVRALAR